MGQLADNETAHQHQELCMALNIDSTTAKEAWNAYKEMSHHYTLEGSQLHWLGCSLYVSCRKATVPTVNSNRTIEGNLVCLTSLLKHCKMSLNQFLNKCRKWADMRKLPDSFRSKITRLERNFAVSKVIFTKYLPMFKEMFKPPDIDELLMHVRHNKKKMIHCTSTKVFEFTWILFVLTKAEYLDVSNDLVNSFHLLIATCDLIYANVIQSKLRDIVNPDFEGMPSNFLDSHFAPLDDPPCIISILCKHHDDLSAILEPENFDYNFKVVNKMYEEYILSVGDFDERIFLPKFQSFDETAPGSSGPGLDDLSPAPAPGGAPPEVDFGIDFTSFRRNLRQMTPRTPLTGRHYLSKRDLEYGNVTPVKTATQSISRLNLLCGRDPNPSPALTRIFEACNKNPQPLIDSVLTNLGDKFTQHYSASGDTARDFAEKRLSVAVCLYYKLLESILADEQKKPAYDFNVLLSLQIFHETLFACCIEIVIFCYNSNSFPWILSVLGIEPYHFYKVIEVIVRAEASLSRDIVKHLNLTEEQVLDSLAWVSNSPLWKNIEDSGQEIPGCEQVTLASQLRSPLVISGQREGEESAPAPGGGATPVSDRFQSPITRRGGTTPQPGPASRVQIVQGGSPTRVIFYHLAFVRMEELCSQLHIDDEELKHKIWTCFEYSITHGLDNDGEHIMKFNTIQHKIWTCFEYSITHGLDNDGEHIMKDRHVDQLIMSSVYIICKVANSPQYEKTFTEIMKCYRLQPQCNSNVYRFVLLTRNNGKEERGDLIKFYNMVYVKVMQDFARKFSRSLPPELLTLSPLPVGRAGGGGSSPYRRVSDKFGLFIRSLDHTVFPLTPAGNSNTYCFTRSPAKDLHAINSMIRSDFDSASSGGSQLISSRKRPLQLDPPLLVGGKKANFGESKPINRKLQALVGERQSVLQIGSSTASPN
ncbi:hypothetical protein M8J76_005480 [Diaphorina citri]|nr:hypothetical protein M8J76_005480 [Diaphorina citri]